MTGFFWIDSILAIPSSFMVVTAILKQAGTDIELPENLYVNPTLGLIIGACIAVYWASRGIAILLKGWGEYKEKMQDVRMKRTENDKRQDGYMVQRGVTKADKEQYRKIMALEEKHRQETEELHKKLNLK